MTNKKSKYVVYMLRRLSPGILGETYAIVTGTEVAPEDYRAEHFLLTQRPSEALHAGHFDIGGKLPPDVGVIDIDFAITEAYRQVEIDIQLMLEKRAGELERPDLTYQAFELQERSVSLLSCWMRGRFTEQLIFIKNSTKCPSLAFYLNLLQQNSAIGSAQ